MMDKQDDTNMREYPCIVCGKTFVCRGYAPKLYCSNQCREKQNHAQLFTREERDEEIMRRRTLYYGSLSETQKAQIEYKRKHKRSMATITVKKPVEKQKPLRVCHDCGKPCNDYRCHECWIKLRRWKGLTENHDETESAWDYF